MIRLIRACIIGGKAQPAGVEFNLSELDATDRSRLQSFIRLGWAQPVGSSDSLITHVGGGMYELPDGRRVKGKQKALEALTSEP